MSKHKITSGTQEERVLRYHEDYSIIPCEVCLKEVPQDLAETENANEYILYFCGLECHGIWKKDRSEENH